MATVKISLKDYEIIDLMGFKNLSKKRRDKVLIKLEKNLANFGFMVFKNHGVSMEVLDKCYKNSMQFFELPTIKKGKYALSVQKKYSNVGYFRFQSETAVNNQYPDLKEFWHVGREVPFYHRLNKIYTKNPWPNEIHPFKTNMVNLYSQMEQTGINIMSMLALVLGSEEDYFEKLIENGSSILRSIHYPILPKKLRKSEVRAALHTGIQLIGLQPKTSHPGLQFLLPNGDWGELTQEFEKYLSVNVGDMLEAISNKFLKATLHRVINPKQTENESRYAIVYFFHASPLEIIKQIATQTTSRDSKTFKPILAGDWLLQRFDEISRKDK